MFQIETALLDFQELAETGMDEDKISVVKRQVPYYRWNVRSD